MPGRIRRFLYLCSGDPGREDSSGAFLDTWGIEADLVDKVNVEEPEGDLADDAGGLLSRVGSIASLRHTL